MLDLVPPPKTLPLGTSPCVSVRQLDHVAVVVADLDRSFDFYAGVLGMTPVPRPAFSFDGLWFEAGGTLVHVILEHDGSGPAGEQFGDFEHISRTQHMAFAVENAVACAESLRAAGVEIVAGPKGRPDGAAQTVIQDPDGYVIELVSDIGGDALVVDAAASTLVVDASASTLVVDAEIGDS